MSNVKWVGTPCGYTRSRTKKKRTDRWPTSMPMERVKVYSQPMGSDYWFGVIGLFLLCFALMVWAALAGA